MLIALIALTACGRQSDEGSPAEGWDSVSYPEIATYVSRVAGSLSGDAPPQIILYDSPVAQSFALPDGSVGLSVGLLAFMQSEAELACVLGHELAHHELGHVRERFGTASELTEEISAAATRQLATGWPQAEEIAADQRGVRLCAGGDYTPLALANLLYRAGLQAADVDLTRGDDPAPPEAMLARVRALVEFIGTEGLQGSRIGAAEYARAVATLTDGGNAALEPSSAARGLLRDPVTVVVYRNLALLWDMDELEQEGRDATFAWIDSECARGGVNTLPSNYLDAFGHCAIGCAANRRCDGLCGNPGIYYEIARELGYRGDHDSFWQDWRNQNVGAGLHDQEGSCYAICDEVLRGGGLDLTAPQRKWWDCESGELLDEPPEDGAYRAYSATTYGDPHMVTADGLRYDFQAAGEFIAVEDPAGELQVQLRLEPVAALRASKTTAVAANVHGDRVGVYATPAGMQVRVNGEPHAVAEAHPLPRGGELRHQADRAIVRWQDGHVLRVDASYLLLDVALELTPSPSQRLRGLYGVIDGDPSNDLTTRDGQRIELPEAHGPERYGLLYETFGQSWRVASEESLFDYAPGQTTESFQQPAYPAEDIGVEALDAPGNARARAVCIATGVLSQPWLDDCIFDVGLTGEAQYADSAIRAAQRHGSRSLAEFASRRIDITTAGTHIIETFRGRTGAALFFQTVRLDGSLDLSNWELVGPDGALLFSRCLRCNQPGREVLPAPGEYTSRIRVSGGERGTLTVRRHRIPPPQRFSVAVGTEITPGVPRAGAGRIEVPGAVDVYRIEAPAGGALLLRVTAVAPQLYFARWTLSDPQGAALLEGGLPSAGLEATSVPLATAGTYSLTVSGGESWPAGDDYGYGDYAILVEHSP